MAFKRFAWQGLEFQIPEEWELGQDKGDYASGFIRLDDPMFARLGVNWQTVKEKKVKSPAEFLKSLKKTLKKRNKDIRFLAEKETKVCDHSARYFRWKAIGEGLDLFWYCRETRRAFAAEFTFKPDEYAQMRAAMDSMIETFRCHGDEKLRSWTLSGLELQVPSGFKLTERGIYATRIHLFFTSKTASLMVDRVAFAQSLLSETYHDLKEWFEKVYRRELRRRYRGIRLGRYKRARVLGHDALATTSTYRRGVLMRRCTVESKAWLCERSNKLFAVSTSVTSKDGNVNKDLKRVLASIRCHEGSLEEPVSNAVASEEKA